MELKLNARVKCSDGDGGHLVQLIINPVTEEVTHIVVKDHGTERVLPLSLVREATEQLVTLNISHADLETQPPFVEVEFVHVPVERLEMVSGSSEAYSWPYVVYETHPVEHKRIPLGELAIKRGTAVFAEDHKVGHIHELVVDSECNHLSHLVLAEGHFWGEKEVTIGVSHIESILNDGVHLDLTKAQIHELPSVSVRRHLW